MVQNVLLKDALGAVFSGSFGLDVGGWDDLDDWDDWRDWGDWGGLGVLDDWGGRVGRAKRSVIAMLAAMKVWNMGSNLNLHMESTPAS